MVGIPGQNPTKKCVILHNLDFYPVCPPSLRHLRIIEIENSLGTYHRFRATRDRLGESLQKSREMPLSVSSKFMPSPYRTILRAPLKVRERICTDCRQMSRACCSYQLLTLEAKPLLCIHRAERGATWFAENKAAALAYFQF